MDKDIQKIADEIREKSKRNKGNEEENEKKERIKNVLSKRDAAIQTVEDYQDKTGIPEDNKIDNNFLKENKVNLNIEEFLEKENEE